MSFLDILRPYKITTQITLGGLLALWVVRLWLRYKRVLRSINYHPGPRTLLSTNGLAANILPYIPGIALGYNWGMTHKFSVYSDVGWDMISNVSFFPNIKSMYLVADPVAVREIVPHRYRWPKPTETYDIIKCYGSNIIVTEGEEWKKHRKVASPIFSEKNNKLVWDETINIVQGLFDVWGRDTKETLVENANSFTVAITLMVIATAGFGRRISWKDDDDIPSGHTMSFQNALHTVSSTLQIKFITPKWAYCFSERLRHIGAANDDLMLYFREMIQARRSAEIKEERYDLLSALLDESNNEKSRLTDDEVIGNMFVFLVAGHETTAHTACFALGLLALEQEEQEELYQHIKSILPNNEIPTYNQMNQLTRVMAVVNEALRLYPPVAYIPKTSSVDQTLPCMRPDGTIGTAVCPKGTPITLNTTGLHYNPRYWLNPTAFLPSRFLDPDWPKDAFLPFSAGPRACLGRKFAETESVAILTLIVSRYKIEVAHPELYAGLTPAEKRAKLLANSQGITTTPIKVPLLFKKR